MVFQFSPTLLSISPLENHTIDIIQEGVFSMREREKNKDLVGALVKLWLENNMHACIYAMSKKKCQQGTNFTD